jgi:uncharacterized RDD family membrane protein YckC
VIDIFVMGFVCLLLTQAIVLTGEFFRLHTLSHWHPLVSAAYALTVFVVLVGYMPVLWTITGRSVGKAILGLGIVRVDGRPPTFARSMLRFCAYWLSALPLGLGFLWVLIDPSRRALHDKIAGTRVVYQPERRLR